MKSRRDFIKQSIGGVALCCGIAVSGATLGACATAVKLNSERKDGLIYADLLGFEEASFALVEDTGLDAPIYVRKISESKFRAVLMKCTHKGCSVDPAGAILVCPCHGAEFSGTGEVLKGPAAERLREFPVSLEGEKLIIDTTK